jgi:hypothetical protein
MLEDKSGLIQLRIKKFIEGYDERKYPIHIRDNEYMDKYDDHDKDDNIDMLYKIQKYIWYKEILEILEKSDITDDYKLELIDKHTNIFVNDNQISSFNLLAGDLYKNYFD